MSQLVDTEEIKCSSARDLFARFGPDGATHRTPTCSAEMYAVHLWSVDGPLKAGRRLSRNLLSLEESHKPLLEACHLELVLKPLGGSAGPVRLDDAPQYSDGAESVSSRSNDSDSEVGSDKGDVSFIGPSPRTGNPISSASRYIFSCRQLLWLCIAAFVTVALMSVMINVSRVQDNGITDVSTIDCDVTMPNNTEVRCHWMCRHIEVTVRPCYHLHSSFRVPLSPQGMEHFLCVLNEKCTSLWAAWASRHHSHSHGVCSAGER